MSQSATKERPLIPMMAGVAVMLCIGILYLWSAFRTPVVEYYNWTTDAATMVASYMLMGFVLGLLIGGILVDRIGPRPVATVGCLMFCGGIFATSLLTSASIAFIYVTYSLISGLGCGMGYSSILNCMQKWMPHRRGLAAGIAVGAFGASVIIFSPLSSWLLTIVDIQTTFRILSILFFVVSMIACLFLRLPSEEYIASLNLPAAAVSAASRKQYTLSEAIKTVPFWCLFGYLLTLNCTWTLTNPMITDLALDRGLSAAAATMTLTFTGLFSTIGRLFFASLSDKIGRVPTMCMLSVITIGCALCMMFAQSYLYCIVVWIAVAAYGAGGAVTPVLAAELFGPKHSGANYGVIVLSLGLSSILSNWMSATLLMGDPVPSFLMGAVSAFVSLALVVTAGRVGKKLAV